MSWMVAVMMTSGAAYAADGPVDVAPFFAQTVTELAVTARPNLERPRFREPPPTSPMPGLPTTDRPIEPPPAKEASNGKHRSRALLLGALGAEVAAGALLGGASLAKTSYLDPANDPGRGLYRTNRVLGHAGYASAVAGGALVLGSVSMWEW
jgi:hypothetical protein